MTTIYVKPTGESRLVTVNVTAETTQSYNFSNVSSTEENQLPFDDVTVAVVAVILLFFLVVGFIGNLLTMLVILTSKRLKNVFNQFILSLCVSDLISSIISWINLYRRTWGFNVFSIPNFFCVFYWGADMWTSYVTAQHILSFAILRLLSVWQPVYFSKIKPLHAKIWISVIWAVAFVCGFIPFAIFSGARERDRTNRTLPVARWPSCTQNQEWFNQYSEYGRFAYPIFFYVPLVAVAIVSVMIAIVMKRRWIPETAAGEKNSKTAKRRLKEKQAIMQLVLIVGSFMLGYIPFTAFEFYTINTSDNSFAGWKKEWMFGTVQYICLRFSECLNPIFYNLASTKMRKETCLFLKKMKCRVCIIENQTKPDSRTTTQTGLDL